MPDTGKISRYAQNDILASLFPERSTSHRQEFLTSGTFRSSFNRDAN